jgi:hypothetical protein
MSRMAQSRHCLPQSQNEGNEHNLCRVSQAPEEHDLRETEASITMKLKRGMFPAIFFLACIAAPELEQVVLEEI